MQSMSAKVPPYRTFLIVSAALVAALWGELFLAHTLGHRFTFVSFSIAIALILYFAGFAPGLAAIMLSALAADYFLIEPGTLFSLESPRTAGVLAAFVVSWTSIALLVRRI